MNRTFAVLLLLTATLLGGCASSSPELRPYTADETRELALEALNRRGLSFDEYHAKKPSCSVRRRKTWASTIRAK